MSNEPLISIGAPMSLNGMSAIGPYEVRIDGVLVGLSYAKRSAERLYKMCVEDPEYAVFLRDSRESRS